MFSRTRARAGIRFAIPLIAAIALCIDASATQTTTFTYQGRLTDNGAPANAVYDLQFTLWDAASGGIQQPQPGPITRTLTNVTASNGIFTVELDFTINAFGGADRFLEIGVRPAGGGSFTILGQRQQISASPYAIRTISAGTADALSSACVGCVQDAQISSISGSKVSGQIPIASVPALGTSYIQNSVSTQAGANFNIAGSGTAGSLTVNGPETFLGVGAPAVAPVGQGRVYFDAAAGKLKVSESGADYVNLVGASGVSGSGTANTIPLWSAGTTIGNSVMTQSGGSIGIGLSNPASKLHVAGSATIATPFRGLTVDQSVNVGQNTSGYAMKVATTTGGVTGTDFLIDALGNTGIGTDTPSQRLHVTQGGDYQLRIENPAFGGGFWNIGQSDNVFNTGGGKLLFVPGTTNSNAATVAFTNGGNVGIGTTNPTAGKLVVNDTTVGTGVVGTSSLGSGVFGQSTSATGWGVYGKNAAGGYGVYSEGNAGQPMSTNGFVKAMLLVNADGSINLCYNSQLTGNAATTPPCGFTVDHSSFGDYRVTFPFQINSRFFSATIGDNNGTGGVQIFPLDPTTVKFFSNGGFTENRVYLLVF